MKKYRKSTFDNIPEEKRNRILKAAIKEFAENGYRGTNISGIASRAEISAGSVYRYYESKEDLYLDIIKEGYQTLEGELIAVFATEGDLFSKIEKVLIKAREFSKENPESMQLYLESTTESLSQLNPELWKQVEAHSANFYRALVAAAKDSGTINSDAPDGIIAFFLDNLFMMHQFSYASTYFKERMKLYIGDLDESKDQQVIDSMMSLIKKALG